jgi:hypothetical protein
VNTAIAFALACVVILATVAYLLWPIILSLTFVLKGDVVKKMLFYWASILLLRVVLILDPTVSFQSFLNHFNFMRPVNNLLHNLIYMYLFLATGPALSMYLVVRSAHQLIADWREARASD